MPPCSDSSFDKSMEILSENVNGRHFTRCLPLNFRKDDLKGIHKDRMKIGARLADVDPMQTDCSVRFDGVGGLSDHISALKEMVVFPLLYPEVFERFKIQPPRGCLFYGPPGTGKTLVARALANECSQGDRRIAFFMRKGADCLSKWAGESERQLRLLFDQAYQMRPSIIFFDEIDGLAPVRSCEQDEIHSSIVSTLLALMDGLDSRGEIVVIGATNRLDSIDPALRRPGRFDREFLFSLPNKEVPDYDAVIKQPMDLSAVLSKIDLHQYLTAGDFLKDIDLICSNALQYNPDKDPGGLGILPLTSPIRFVQYSIDTKNERDCIPGTGHFTDTVFPINRPVAAGVSSPFGQARCRRAAVAQVGSSRVAGMPSQPAPSPPNFGSALDCPATHPDGF
ncbi:ATPase family AAA domain-containing protein 2-like [Gavia stellata]|uniref:ATPase family AAA domain-containing protein 2-like n=1 Tax=Gavia stellata TaxID=37040 RepID=UPI00289DFAA3|nr:ATPase family AAA domain-containing protein 2-like [Gavia stellata]